MKLKGSGMADETSSSLRLTPVPVAVMSLKDTGMLVWVYWAEAVAMVPTKAKIARRAQAMRATKTRAVAD